MLRTVTMLCAALVTVMGVFDARAQETAGGRRSLCVISIIGESFTLKKIAVMAFGNDETELSIDAWGIDDRVAAKAEALLGHRFAVRRITPARGALAQPKSTGFNFLQDANAEFSARLRRVVGAQKCDLYLVFSKAYSKYGSTNQFINGLGLVEAASFASVFHLHALTAITVFDGRTFEILKSERASIGQSTLITLIVGPHREVPASAWPRSHDVSQNEPLRNATWALLEQSIGKTISELSGGN